MVNAPVARGEVYWIDLGETRGSEQAGRRPAVIVQNDLGNRYGATTIVAAITSRPIGRRYPFHVALPNTMLPRPSTVLCEQLATVSLDRLVGPPIARLTPDLVAQLDLALRRSLGLPGV